MPARSLRIIFSATSPCCGAVVASNDASESPPALPRSLWQPAQYCLTSAVCGSDGWATDGCEPGVGADEDGACSAANTVTPRSPIPAKMKLRFMRHREYGR